MAKMKVLEDKKEDIGNYCYQELEWQTAMDTFKGMALDWNQWPQKMECINILEIESCG